VRCGVAEQFRVDAAKLPGEMLLAPSGSVGGGRWARRRRDRSVGAQGAVSGRNAGVHVLGDLAALESRLLLLLLLLLMMMILMMVMMMRLRGLGVGISLLSLMTRLVVHVLLPLLLLLVLLLLLERRRFPGERFAVNVVPFRALLLVSLALLLSLLSPGSARL
jgi:hypothetical protein